MKISFVIIFLFNTLFLYAKEEDKRDTIAQKLIASQEFLNCIDFFFKSKKEIKKFTKNPTYVLKHSSQLNYNIKNGVILDFKEYLSNGDIIVWVYSSNTYLISSTKTVSYLKITLSYSSTYMEIKSIEKVLRG